MKKIIVSSSIVLAVIAVVVGATTAFYGDTETSTGNILAAGAIDLGIDNMSYYNGEFNEGTSWKLDYDLDDQEPRLFFDFEDLKPGDWGEDTISIHVDDNPAWGCVEIALTANNDNGLTEPEEDDGDTTGGDGEGELGGSISFMFWADDGDNVLELDETEGMQNFDSLTGLVVGQPIVAPLASPQGGIFGNIPLNMSPTGEPVDMTYYIGKAWCFGDMVIDPVEPGDNNSPTIDPGFHCDGSQEDNTTQTDSLEGDVTFSVEQERNNPNFSCFPRPTETPGT